MLELLGYGQSGWLDELLLGALGTMALLVVSFPVGIILGMGLAHIRLSKEKTIRLWGNIVTVVFRGIPDLLMLFIFYYLGQRLLNNATEYMGLSNIEMSMFFCGVAALSILLIADSSEIFMNVLKSMNKGPIEAAMSLGMNRFTTFRRIILPELLRLSESGLSNLWLILHKRTSIVSIISYTELLRQTHIAANSSEQHLFFYFVACVLYALIALITLPFFRYIIGYYRFRKYVKKI